MKRLVGILLLFGGPLVLAQEVLHYDGFMGLVVQNHPVAKQAELLDDMSAAQLMKARGAFDPKVGGTFRQKYFEDKKYYQEMQGMLKVPTWFGVEVKAGYDNGYGNSLNPELGTPSGGLFLAGISVPIGKGLFIDQRRADLKTAKILGQKNTAEQREIINNLILEAGNAYWMWVAAYHALLVRQNGVKLAERRLDFVSREVQFKNKAAIDTLEARIQLQNRIASLTEANNDLQNAAAYLAVFLWDDDARPVELADGVAAPELLSLSVVSPDENRIAEVDSLLENHPEYLEYGYQLDALQIERKLKVEELKPILNLNYNPLVRVVQSSDVNQPFLNNYKWGVEVGIPLFLRKERAGLKMTNVKISDVRYDQDLKLEMLKMKTQSAFNDWTAAYELYKLYGLTSQNYEALLQGERELYRAGESTVFMVNSRENKYLEAQVKSINYLAKNQVSYMKTQWSLANLKP